MKHIGIIGAGGFAKAHIEALKRMPERARVVAVARHSPSIPFPEADAIGARMESVASLLTATDIDAISLCVPNNLHRAYAEAAMRAGKHVFCEKPMALTVPDADAMIDTAKETGKVLMVGHLTRHLPIYARAAEILESGRLGDPRSAYVSRFHCGAARSWRMDPAIGGGVVFDLLIHDIDLVNWYLGTPQYFVAHGHKHEQGAYDQVAAIATYKNDRMAVIEGAFVFRPPAGLRAMLRIVCERGHLEINTTDRVAPLRIFEEGQEEELINLPMDKFSMDGLPGEFEEFFDALEGRLAGRLCLEDARNAVAVASAITEALINTEPLAEPHCPHIS